MSNLTIAPAATSILFLLLASVSLALSVLPRAAVCNGYAELCSRSYGNITYAGAHDSYAIGPTSRLGANQDQRVTQQLNDGIRMLQMQAHLQDGQIFLCHTSCTIFNGGSLQDYLTTVKTWLDANPNEVLTLLIVNIDNLPASQYDAVFKAVGLDVISYVPSTNPVRASNWPTLGSMIDSERRLVTFLDNGADPAVPYLLDEFTNIWETAFDVTNPTFDCNVNRTKGATDTQMYLINHFLDATFLGKAIPDIAQLNVTNAASSLGAQADACILQNARSPNFMLVDFYEFGGGSVFQVAASLNGVIYNQATPVAVPVPTATSTGISNGGTRIIFLAGRAWLVVIGTFSVVISTLSF